MLRLLEKHKVEYMIVGGYAVAFLGFPRFTRDMHVFYRVAAENLTKLRTALMEFGFMSDDLPEEAFTTMGNLLTFGVAPSRVHLLNEIDGVDYDAASRNTVRGRYGNVEVTFIGRLDLIRNKQSTPRIKDKGDVEELTREDDFTGD